MITAARILTAQIVEEACCTPHFIAQYLQLILVYLHNSIVNESVLVFWEILSITDVFTDMCAFHIAPLS